MNETTVSALQITLLGMGLVFGALILLWAIMSLLVRATAEAEEQPAPQQALKQEAAAVAVAIALAQAATVTKPHLFPLPATAFVSAWQAVTRGNLLNKRGPVR